MEQDSGSKTITQRNELWSALNNGDEIEVMHLADDAHHTWKLTGQDKGKLSKARAAGTAYTALLDSTAVEVETVGSKNVICPCRNVNDTEANRKKHKCQQYVRGTALGECHVSKPIGRISFKASHRALPAAPTLHRGFG